MATPLMIRNFKDPEKLLYHYTSMARAKDLILPSGRLRMGRYSGTNDPKESKCWEFDLGRSGDGDMLAYKGRELSTRLSNTLKDRCRVLCFSKDAGPLEGDEMREILKRGFAYPRMWAQYGEKHTGVCLVFDKTKLERCVAAATAGATHAFGGRVTYRDRSVLSSFEEADYLINLDYLDKHGFDVYWRQHLQQFRHRLFFEKLQDWRDEHEFRYVAFVEPDQDVEVEFGDALEGVIFGDAANEKCVDEVIDMLLPTKVEMMGLKWKNCAPWYDFGSFKYDRQLRQSPWFRKKDDSPSATGNTDAIAPTHLEEVKTKETLHVPDIRRTCWMITNNRTGSQRPISFEDHETSIGDIPIPARAPDEIKDLLVTSKNLLLYSWYYYPFSMSASLQAAAALEQALRLKLNATERDTLGYLLRKAVNGGVLTDGGFPRWKRWRAAFAQLHPSNQPAAEPDLAELLTEIFPRLRNSLAHGNRLVDDIGFRHLDIVCEAIEQLYPQAPQ